ncbi:hypothetical protein VFPFJ_11287 [Purpureocillium lilacinum]|uniref:Uncharacterized protein n=1 Tax=Purpureocillium lilacinum TaxID=33203 RepID=A0A179FG00_PURLI|nr:hypothetical protein VFPFJ_11287 [Purpureocillium lilacinum]OAQ63923.1 hypothetical protein VFPFJ_11287 [Purpureocillium lilacinum]OAQ76992.1 hypothetical protein VFPBJ_07464 [Purpureocillium lilacinum]
MPIWWHAGSGHGSLDNGSLSISVHVAARSRPAHHAILGSARRPTGP